MRNWNVGIAGLISVAALLAGCGGSIDGGGGGSCGKVSPCGGSLAGTWTITSSCESVFEFTDGIGCPGSHIDEARILTSGTLVFDADMNYTTTLSTGGTRRFNVPLACVSGIDSCDDFATWISPGPPDATTTCTTVGSTCNCTMVKTASMTWVETGVYWTADNVLTLSPVASAYQFSYCVQGSTLHLINTDSWGAVIRDVVATQSGSG